MSRLSILISCFFLIFATSTVMAGTACTSQTWTFSSYSDPNLPISADPGFCNAYGTPTATLSTTENPDLFGWLAEYDGREGVWVGDPLVIDLTIHNNPIPNAYKTIYLEMEFQSTLDWIAVVPSPLTGSSVEVISPLDITPTGCGQWQKLTIGWRIEPNPEYETICMNLIGSGGFVNYITVDTCCIPEPATLVLLGLGGLALMRRSKR